MRRAWLCGRENVHKRDLIHVAGLNLGLLMRAIHGAGSRSRLPPGRTRHFRLSGRRRVLIAIAVVLQGGIALIAWRVVPEEC
jgi:hypothetical protein